MKSFEDCKALAMNDNLNSNEKVGFDDIHRNCIDQNIFPDILYKLQIARKK